MGHYKVSGIIKVPILSAFLDFMVLVCSAFDEVGKNKSWMLLKIKMCALSRKSGDTPLFKIDLLIIA
jgi:hypothetical protein